MTARTSERGKKPFSRKTIGVARLSVVKQRPHVSTVSRARASGDRQQRENVRVTIKVTLVNFTFSAVSSISLLADNALVHILRIRARPVANAAASFPKICALTIPGRAKNRQIYGDDKNDIFVSIMTVIKQYIIYNEYISFLTKSTFAAM